MKPKDAQNAQDDDAHLTYDDVEEEDDLGYYEDGVKRTLTDDQIAIFRHSELKSLRRQQEKEQSKLDTRNDTSSGLDENAGSLEQGEHSPHEVDLPSTFRSNKQRKKKKTGNRQRAEPKPDLRKRTWDVVDKGLDTLEYD